MTPKTRIELITRLRELSQEEAMIAVLPAVYEPNEESVAVTIEADKRAHILINWLARGGFIDSLSNTRPEGPRLEILSINELEDHFGQLGSTVLYCLDHSAALNEPS